MDREREWITMSVLAINHAHEIGAIDPLNDYESYIAAEGRGPVVFDTTFDGDIPARITVRQPMSAPTSVRWELWPDERGRRTFGNVVLHRLPGWGIRAVIGNGSYERARVRSSRLSRIPTPDALWGLTSEHFQGLGISTYY